MSDAMPHVSNDSGGDDLCSSDEVKVFKDEGEEKRSSENLNELTEEQHDLIDLSESEVTIVRYKVLCMGITEMYTHVDYFWRFPVNQTVLNCQHLDLATCPRGLF